MGSEQIVSIIDDDEGVRESIYELVSSVGLKASTYAGAQEFLEDFSVELAGCLIVDVRMARMSGLALQKKLNELGATIPVIFLSAYGDVTTVVAAMKAGAVDFIEKPYREQKLLDSINLALLQDLEQRRQNRGEEEMKAKLKTLTKRETEVLALLAREQNTKQLAGLLGISPRTVEVHRQRVLHKLGASSVSDIVELLDTSNI